MKMNVFKGALATTIILGLVAFTNTVEKKQVDVKESTILWEGEKIDGFSLRNYQFERRFFLDGGRKINWW